MHRQTWWVLSIYWHLDGFCQLLATWWVLCWRLDGVEPDFGGGSLSSFDYWAEPKHKASRSDKQMREILEITFDLLIFLQQSNTLRVQNFKYQSPGCVGSNFIVVQLEWKRTRPAYDQLDHRHFNVVVVVRVIEFGDSATQWSVLVSTYERLLITSTDLPWTHQNVILIVISRSGLFHNVNSFDGAKGSQQGRWNPDG